MTDKVTPSDGPGDGPGDLVIGAAYGYDEDKVRAFLTSLQATGYAGSTVLVVTKAQARAFAGSALFADVDLAVVPVWRPAIPDVFSKRATAAVWLPLWLLTWAALNVLRLGGRRGRALRIALAGRLYHPWCARHFHYLQQLDRRSYRNVMITDTRDVVFQGDPSAVMDGATDLSVSLENDAYRLGDDGWNAEWIRTLYGPDTVRALSDEVVSCAGVSFASAPRMRDYLERMTAEMLAFTPWNGWRASDQAVHNVLLRTGRLGTFSALPSLSSPVATLHATAVDDLRIDTGTLLNRDGSAVSVIHQYDRVAGLPERLTAVTGRRTSEA